MEIMRSLDDDGESRWKALDGLGRTSIVPGGREFRSRAGVGIPSAASVGVARAVMRLVPCVVNRASPYGASFWRINAFDILAPSQLPDS